jgi:uncharacterized protein YjgD (DUF1641 family)
MSSSSVQVKSPIPISGERDLQQQVSALEHKVDLLLQQVGYMHQRATAVEELKDELVLIARDAMRALQIELGEIEHEFNAEAITYLLRKVLRSTPRLIRLLQSLENAQDLFDELGPLSKEVMRDLMERFQTWEERGYFRLAKGGLEIVDNVANHASQEDIDRLAENVTLIIDTVKRSTQPELLNIASNAVAALDGKGNNGTAPVGLWGLMSNMRDPEIQVGVGILFELLRQVARTRGNGASVEDKQLEPLERAAQE